MKLSIVNFSDVHFMAGNNSILEKQQLIKAIASRINSSEKIISNEWRFCI